MDDNTFFTSELTPHHTIADGITRQVMGHSEAITLARVTFRSGVSAEMHSHDKHDQSSYIACGKFEVIVGGQKRVLGSGDGFFIPRGVAHNATCVESGVLIDTFSPGRSDLISYK